MSDMALDEESMTVICPAVEELSVIRNNVVCDFCNAVFCSEARFRMHKIKVHEKKDLEKVTRTNVRYKCPVESCIYASNPKKYFAVHKYLKQHYLKVHAEKKFTCTQCTRGFPTNSALEAHGKVCGIVYICDTCLRTFSSYESLLTHARRTGHKKPDIYIVKKNKKKPIRKCIKVDEPSIKVQKVYTKDPPFVEKKTIFILPKQTCDVGVQTEGRNSKPKRRNTFVAANKICRQTQTSEAVKENSVKISAETQTCKSLPRVIRVRQLKKRDIPPSKTPEQSLNVQTTVNLSDLESLNAEQFLLDSPLSLRDDIIFHDFWEDKSTGTQTSPEKNIFDFEFVEPSATYQSPIRSDPMLTEKTFNDKFSSIETQTEEDFRRSLFDSEVCLSSSNNETQTIQSMNNIYNNTCTQTCEDFLSADLVFSDIQTQTAWCDFDEATFISTETQTKDFKCQPGCNYPTEECKPWFPTETNHMETQTDLLSILEELV